MYLRPSSTPHWQAFIMVTVVSFVLFDEGENRTGINQLANLVCTTCVYYAPYTHAYMHIMHYILYMHILVMFSISCVTAIIVASILYLLYTL